MNITEKIEALEAQLKELKQELNKPAFEVGKWYKSNRAIYYKGDTNAYGLNDVGQWVEYQSKNIGWESYKFVPATDKEVEEALIEEAIKRGFKEGGIVKGDSYFEHSYGGIITDSATWEYDINKDELSLIRGIKTNIHGVCRMIVYKQGKWAEIIKDEPIKIGGYEVKRDEGGIIKIGCKKINTFGIQDIRQFMKTHGFKKVAFDGIETDLETIEKILKL